jgi:tRNA nucleotidyltransferase/poly(A) polymerase
MMSIDFLLKQIPPSHFKELSYLSSRLIQHGFECYLVGGSVRDLVMGKVPKEYDFTTSAKPEQVKSIFKKVIDTGIQHGTVTVLLGELSVEVTTYRQDIGYTDGRRPDSIIYGNSLFLDLERRDFTMNALALDLVNQTFVDKHNGLADIQNKLIRTIGNPLDRFSEDGLRPIRAIRFMATLEFAIEENTYKAIYHTRNITQKISRERFHDELNKILLSDKPSIGVKELIRNQIFDLFIQTRYSSKTNFEKIDQLDKEPLGLRLGFLLDTYLYENATISVLESILKSLKYSKKNCKDSLFFQEMFSVSIKEELSSSRRILSKILMHSSHEQLDKYVSAYLSYVKVEFGSELFCVLQNHFQSSIGAKVPLTIKELAIDGNLLVQKFPSIEKKQIGKLLNACLDKCLDDPFFNTFDHLVNYIRLLQEKQYV